MIDKPPPYRRPDPEGFGGYQGPLNTVTDKVFAAYKTSPTMIAMIVLLLTILGALGFYMLRNDDRIYGYIALRDKRESGLFDRLVEMALKCRDKDIDKTDSFPLPNFPNLTTGGPAFKPKENRK